MWFDFLRFKIIFELKNLTHAAIALNITQPALSKSLKRLEDYFDCSFFQRSKSGLTPHTHAQTLYLTIVDMESKINTLAKSIHPLSLPSHKKLTIGLSKVWNYIYFPQVLKNNLLLEESSQFKILYERSVSHYQAIKEGKMDFALTRFISDPELAKGVIFEPIFQTRHGLFCLGGKAKKGMKVVHLGYETDVSNSLTVEGEKEIKAELEKKDAIIEDAFLLRELLKTGHYTSELPLDFKHIFSKTGIFEITEKSRYFSSYWCGIVYRPESVYKDLIKALQTSIKTLLSKSITL